MISLVGQCLLVPRIQRRTTKAHHCNSYIVANLRAEGLQIYLGNLPLPRSCFYHHDHDAGKCWEYTLTHFFSLRPNDA
jgi:hypothetical protein